MPLIESAIFEHLNADADLTALLGDRIFPIVMHQGTAMPSMVYQQISGVREYHLGGRSCIAESRYQFSNWDRSYLGAKQLSVKLRKAFELNYPVTIGTANAIKVFDARIVNENDQIDDDTNLFRTILDYIIVYREIDEP